MKFARLGEVGRERPVVVHGDTYYALDGLVGDLDSRFWMANGPALVADALVAGNLPVLERNGLRFGPPIARPSSVVCVGLNYSAHAEEAGAAVPDYPVIFHKAPNTVVGPYDTVAIPPGSTKTDWEVELGVVMGQRSQNLASPRKALDAIAGFVIVNDLSERSFQLEVSGGQWSKGKNFAGFCPTGPYVVTPEEISPHALRLRSWVNGELRQDSTTEDLIFDVESIVYHLSQFMVLEPGDLICTGTPQGVALSGRFPYLRGGDVVELEIAGLGRQRQAFVST